MIGVRRQGGPSDGERASAAELQRDNWTDPPRVWARPCALQGADWSSSPIDGWDVYRRDDVDERGWLVYVYTDESLGGGRAERERELVEAGRRG